MNHYYPAKSIVVLAFLLMTQLVAFSAEFKVKSFEKDDNDLAARRFERQDINGETCALIKIKPDLRGLKFQSGFGIVGDVLFKDGQYWVYVSPREQRLSIYKTGFVRLDYDIPLPVHAYNVFHMVLSSKGQDVNKLPVTFMVEPADARLKVDGESVENEQPVELGIGEHRFLAERENYQPFSKTITVNKQNVLFRFELEEVQDAGVVITSKPAGAKVILDGVFLGETPVSTFYPEGRYPIKLSKEGFLSIEDEYLKIKGPRSEKSYTLEENVGYLTVKTRPEATVRFNGKKVEANTRIKLNPSVVNVKVTMPKAKTLEESVVIKRNDDKTIELMPNIQTGTIQVAVTPIDAKVELIGDAGEHYTAEGMKVFSDIPVGTYQLKVTKEGHKTKEKNLTLRTNDKITQNIRLEKSINSNTIFKPERKVTEHENIIVKGIKMVYVEGGCFDMGCDDSQKSFFSNPCDDDEEPVHRVCVDGFYISKTEITQKQWLEVMGSNPSPSRFKNCDYCPVNNISWNDAQEFIKKLNNKTNGNYRLPTEAEWEYAARGGNKSRGYKYAGSNKINKVAWYIRNASAKTHPVFSKQPNELGLYGMSGNVMEFCSDWYDDNYYKNSPKRNPKGAKSGKYRVARGGRWSVFKDDCRVSNRSRGSLNFRDYVSGFRIAH